MDQSLYLVPVARVCRVRMQATRIPCNSSLRQQEPTTTTSNQLTFGNAVAHPQQISTRIRPLSMNPVISDQSNRTHMNLQTIPSSCALWPAQTQQSMPCRPSEPQQAVCASRTSPWRSPRCLSHLYHNDQSSKNIEQMQISRCERALLRRWNQDEPIK